jgi:protein O-GlcNAc transferase
MAANHLSVQVAYDAALNLTRQGELLRAESICGEILQQRAAHTDALLLRGVIELQTGRAAEAAVSFRRSLQHNAFQPIAEALLGDALLALHQPEEALQSYDRGLGFRPDLVPARLGRGNALLDLDRPREALASYERVLLAQPDHTEALFNCGNARLAIKDYASAVDAYARVLRLDPAHSAAHTNRGSALRALGRPHEALLSFDTALQQRPDGAEAFCGRGSVLLELHRPEEALAAFERAVECKPGLPDAHNGRGNALLALRRHAQAAACFDEALRLDLNYGAANFNRGRALLGMDRRDEALADFERATALKSDFSEAMRARGDLLLAMQRPALAAQCFNELLGSDPEFENAAGSLLHARQCWADWSVSVASATPEDVLRAVLAGKRVATPFAFLSVADSPGAQLRCAQTFVAHRCPAVPALGTARPHRQDRIRVAYVSGDFRAHAVAYLMAGVFELHDRQRFETIAISLRPEEPSAMGRRVKDAFERFVDVSARSDREVAELMRDMQIDVAVDLVGFTDGLRPEIFSLRPAPIQVSYLGYPGTTGAAYMDYILADAFVIPPEHTRHYSERVVYLPDCFQANDDRRTMSERPVTRAEAGLAGEAFVFCCFNNVYKLNPAMFDIWMRLLDRVPDSLLWLLNTGEPVVDNLRREGAHRGVDPARLVFAPRLPYPDHLNRLRLADLFLDTLPFNAGTTASDALWAGLPVLTCAGEAFAARMAGSILKAAGLPELIAHSPAEYEAKALELAQRRDTLRSLRQRLAESRQSAPLFDTDRFRRNLESAYEHMVGRHQRGEGPAGFAVSG